MAADSLPAFLGPPARRAADGGRRGKAWPLEGIFIALRARGLFRCSLFGPPARRAAGGGGEGLSFGMRFLSACGRGAFLLLFIWAACAAGGRWGPVRGCRPSEAPSALPPDDPAGLSISHQPSKPHLHSLRPILLGFPGPTSLRGLRVFCCGSFPPFGRVISLRAAQYHRPLSPCTKAVGTSTCLKGTLQRQQSALCLKNSKIPIKLFM